MLVNLKNTFDRRSISLAARLLGRIGNAANASARFRAPMRKTTCFDRAVIRKSGGDLRSDLESIRNMYTSMDFPARGVAAALVNQTNDGLTVAPGAQLHMILLSEVSEWRFSTLI